MEYGGKQSHYCPLANSAGYDFNSIGKTDDLYDLPYSPCRWESPVIERLSAVEAYSVFVVNACGSKLAGRVELGGLGESPATFRADYSVPARAWAHRPAAGGARPPLDQPSALPATRPPHSGSRSCPRFADGSITGNTADVGQSNVAAILSIFGSAPDQPRENDAHHQAAGS